MALGFLGLQKTTLIDYPGEVAATLFTPGCNLKCPYCHNPELITGSPPPDFIRRSEVRAFLKKRSTVLGGVCITGGEPLLHEDIGELIALIHSFGLKVKIDTNGTYPERLKLLKADYIAMDLKTSPESYKKVGAANSKDILKSINYILESEIEHEFRTTVVPGIVDIKDIETITDIIKEANLYVLANFNPEITYDSNMSSISPYNSDIFNKMVAIIDAKGIPYKLRGI